MELVWWLAIGDWLVGTQLHFNAPHLADVMHCWRIVTPPSHKAEEEEEEEEAANITGNWRAIAIAIAIQRLKHGQHYVIEHLPRVRKMQRCPWPAQKHASSHPTSFLIITSQQGCATAP